MTEPSKPEVEDSYVVLQKFSKANPSKYFRVVHFRDYMRFVNGEATELPVIGQRKTYREAQDLCDQHNDEHRAYVQQCEDARREYDI